MCRWQLKHIGLLSLLKQSQKNNLAVREFQGVMVRPRDALIDLAKDRGLVLDSAGVPRPLLFSLPQLRPVTVIVSEQEIDFLLAHDYELSRKDADSIGRAVAQFLSDSALFTR